MHERTQRAVARLLFVFCCAVPTAIIVLSIVVTWTPWYQAQRLRLLTHTLQQETGLAIEISRCRELSPGRYKLENVRFTDPESQRPVATIPVIDWLREDAGTRIVLHEPELRSAALGDAWAMIHDRLIRRPEHTLKPLIVVADSLTIRGTRGTLTQDVEVEITPKKQGVLVLARAKDKLEADSFLQCTLFRDREGPTPTTQISLSTGATPLPCSVLEDQFPVLRRLGPDARFRGTMEFRELPKIGWSYNFDGTTVMGISLSRACETLPYHVSGTTQVHLRRCSIVPGRSVNLSADVSVLDGGWIDGALLDLLSRRIKLGMNTIDADYKVDRKVQYSKAAFNVAITNERMTLLGLCRPGQDYAKPWPKIALCQFGVALAQTPEADFPCDVLTGIFSPPRNELAYWNALLLPTPQTMRIPSVPEAHVGGQAPMPQHR